MVLLSGLVLMPLLLFSLLFHHQTWLKFSLLVGFSLAAVLLVGDVVVFNLFHFHLNETILGFILSSQRTDVFDLSFREEVLACLVVTLVLAIELILYRYIESRYKKSWSQLKRYWLYWGVALLTSYTSLFVSMAHRNNLLTQQVSNLPLYHQVLAFLLPGRQSSRVLYNFSENYFSLPNWGGKHFSYPKATLRCPGPIRPLNIVLLTAEALRFDNLEKGIMSHLATLAHKEISFNLHFATSNATQGSLFSMFYGVPGSYWSQALIEKKPPVLMRLLADNQIERKIIWSSEMVQPAFDKTIYMGLSHLHTSHQSGQVSSDWDRQTTRDVVFYLQLKAKDKKPFFLHVFYNSTHAYCQNNHFSKPYQPELESCQRIGWHSDSYREGLYNRYKNAARFIDGELDKVIETLKQLNLYDNSIVIITSDHGEEFNDTKLGLFGHAGNFTRFQLHVPMVVHWPGRESQQINYPTSHYDIATTLIQSHLQCQSPTGDYSIGQNLFDADNRRRLLNVSSYAYQGVVGDNGIIVFRRSGAIEYQDLMGRKGRDDLFQKQDIAKVLNQLTWFSYKH